MWGLTEPTYQLLYAVSLQRGEGLPNRPGGVEEREGGYAGHKSFSEGSREGNIAKVCAFSGFREADFGPI